MDESLVDDLNVFQSTPIEITGEQSTEEHHLQDDNNPTDNTAKNVQNVEETVELRRSNRVKKLVIPNNYVVYLQESDYDVGLNEDPTSFSQALKGENSTF